MVLAEGRGPVHHGPLPLLSPEGMDGGLGREGAGSGEGLVQGGKVDAELALARSRRTRGSRDIGNHTAQAQRHQEVELLAWNSGHLLNPRHLQDQRHTLLLRPCNSIFPGELWN